MASERKKDRFHCLPVFVGSFQLNISTAGWETYLSLRGDKVVSPVACVHSHRQLLLCHLPTISFLFCVLMTEQIPDKIKRTFLSQAISEVGTLKRQAENELEGAPPGCVLLSEIKPVWTTRTSKVEAWKRCGTAYTKGISTSPRSTIVKEKWLPAA